MKKVILSCLIMFLAFDAFASKPILVDNIGNMKNLNSFKYINYFNHNYYFTYNPYFNKTDIILTKLDNKFNQIQVIDSIYFTKSIINNNEIIQKVAPTNMIIDKEGKTYYYNRTDLPNYIFLENGNEYEKIDPLPEDTNKILYIDFTPLGKLFIRKGLNFYFITKDSIEKYSINTPGYKLVPPNYFSPVFFGDTLFYFNSDGDLIKFYNGEYKIYPPFIFFDDSNVRVFGKLRFFNGKMYFSVFNQQSNDLKLVEYSNDNFFIDDLIKDTTITNQMQLPHISDFNIDSQGNFWTIIYDVTQGTFILLRKNIENWEIIDINKYKGNDSLFLMDRLNSGTPVTSVYVNNKNLEMVKLLLFDEEFNSVPTNSSEKMHDLYFENIYPNPTSNILNIDFSIIPSLLNKLKINIIDYLGKNELKVENYNIIYNNENGKGTLKFNINNLPKGFYLLTLSTGNEIITKSFVKN